MPEKCAGKIVPSVNIKNLSAIVFQRHESYPVEVRVQTLLSTSLKPGFHIIVSNVRTVSVTIFFVKRSGRLSLVSINSSLTQGSSLSQNVLSSDREDRMETLLQLFQTILTTEANRSSR